MTADKRTPLVPKLRFPEFRDSPEWSAPRGDSLFDTVNNRSATPGLPVLAITQEHGAIPREQIDYHVSVTAESVASYKEVCEGDFIISLRSFQGGIEYFRSLGIRTRPPQTWKSGRFRLASPATTATESWNAI
jgi:type I restriction enzyme, S subunit